VSWAFALAAMAIVGSLATVAIVQGSGDDLLRTGAAFVDPSMAKTEPAPTAPAKARAPSTQTISVLDLPPAAPVSAPPTLGAGAGGPVAGAEPGVVEPVSSAEVGAVAPVAAGARVDAKKSAPVAESAGGTRAAVAKESKPEPRDKTPTPLKTARPSRSSQPTKQGAASDVDIVNAAAADALARAQLQQAL